MSTIFAVVITYLVVSFFGYVGHWALHQPWLGKFNEYHIKHHMIQYPPSDYLSDSYRSAGADNTVKVFAILSVPIIITPIFLYALHAISLFLMIMILCEMLSIGWLHDYLHDSFHIRNHFLSKIPVLKNYFNKCVELHYVHHVHLEKNFGIFAFHWDKLFKTFVRRVNYYERY